MKLVVFVFAAWSGVIAAAAVSASVDAEKMQNYLFETARAGDAVLVREIIDAGAQIDARNADGHTALILAAYHGRGSSVDALLAAGADPNIGDRRGNTALMGAIFKGEEAIVLRLLREPRTAIDARNAAGQTAAMFAALFGKDAVIDALAARGADFSLADAAGQTAQKLALQQGNVVLADKIGALMQR